MDIGEWGSAYPQVSQNIHFHAYSSRIKCLHFDTVDVKFVAIVCYMPTSWDTDGAVEEVYSLLDMLIQNAERINAITVLGGDFNASIGAPEAGDDLTLLGACGNGARNWRGARMIHWISERGLQILNRLDSTMAIEECWTCTRALDGALVQLDFLLASLRVRVVKAWIDQSLPIGLDHRCVHCLIRIGGARPAKIKRCAKLKHWQPHLDENGTPSPFHTAVAIALTKLPVVSAQGLEQCLVGAGRNHGRHGSQHLRFVPSRLLADLRLRRRQTNDPQYQKDLSFQIRKLHGKELRDWKSNQLERLLGQSSKWKILRTVEYGTGRWLPEQPQPFEFANMLEQLFAGDLGMPMAQPCLTEAPWTMAELKMAVARLKANKAADDAGLVAELLHHSPEVMLEAMLHLFRRTLLTGEVPETWKQTIFNILPKTRGAKSTSDFRPIAVVRLLYKTFAYLMLGRIEETLEAGQPEEQHGFRAQRRIEEHLLTTNLVLDKTLALDVPVWIVSLDLSKAFDKVKWENLWEALSEHGVSDHMLWVLQRIYYGQTERTEDNNADGDLFHIRGGVRQGCVLSPRLFSCVLEVALGSWRRKVGTAGVDFQDGMRTLLDLRFADDLLLFAKTFQETKFLLDELVTCLAEVGLQLNVRKTKVLTTQSQSPTEVPLRNGQAIEVIDRGSTHKWLGCMLCTANTGNHSLDLAHHLHAASKAFFANRPYLVNRNVAMQDRFRYFNSMVTPVACFGAAHRKVYKQDLCKMDIVFRRLLRSIVGPPGDVDWTLPRHEILHHWNERVNFFTARHGLKAWSAVCLEQYWKFANYVSNLPRERWVVRALNWFPEKVRRVGRPAYTWDSMIQQLCRHNQLGNWRQRAQDTFYWMNQLDEFISFTES